MRKKIKNILLNILFNYFFGYYFQKYQGLPIFLVSIWSQFFNYNLIFLDENIDKKYN